MVGCDGEHSMVRKLAGMEFPGETLADSWVMADMVLQPVVGRCRLTLSPHVLKAPTVSALRRRLKAKYPELVSIFAFNFSLRHYTAVGGDAHTSTRAVIVRAGARRSRARVFGAPRAALN